MSDDCQHCGHAWSGHRFPRCECGCLWPDPAEVQAAAEKPERPYTPEYPYEGVLSAGDVREAFWAATKTLADDTSIHDIDKPYFDEDMEMIDCSGCGMPNAFWEHMVRALVQSKV